MDKPKPQDLFEIARLCSAAPSNQEADPELAAQLKTVPAIIADGADPNELNADGHTPLGMLGALSRGSKNVSAQFARLLIENGANPMINDKPLGQQICHMYSSAVAVEVTSVMGKLEREGKGLRDELGGNLLHYLAVWDKSLATGQLEEDIYQITEQAAGREVPYAEELFFPSEMIDFHRDSDGATPLQVLWQHTSKENPETIADTWAMTEALLALGADPLARDHTGRRAAEIIEQAVAQGAATIGFEDTHSSIQALLDQQRLEAGTPDISKPVGARKPGRL